MNHKQQDELFRHMASQYVEQYGQELQRELEELEQQEPPRITPRLDSRVRKNIVRKRRRYTRWAGLAAACILLALMAPLLFNLTQGSLRAPGEAGSTAAETEMMESETAAPPEAALQTEEQDAPPSAPVYDIIPLSAQLPNNFTLTHMEQDNEKSIYYLADQGLDDVVVTLEWDTWQSEDYLSLTPVPLLHTTAYGTTQDGYSLLTVEHDDIRYVLTCQYDINTLIPLGEAIVRT